MRPAGRLVTIKRSGADGAHFPLSLSSCLFGRGTECDIRIQLPVVSKQHCKIEIKEQKAILCNFSSTNPAQVNGSAIQEPVPLKHGDIITIIDRSFRYEDESRQNGSKSTESPGRTREQRPARRASRAGSSADPDKSEDLSLKRRRVSFGGRLRPELFDENLPPNTPLKKGETPAKRKSLAAHSPAVLKKIIKEQPASLGTESSGVCWEVKAQSVSTGFPAASPRITAAGPGEQRRRSGKASAASGGNKSPQDTPKKAGRKSGQLSSKRTSISRSQHGILQMICSKRRSGASEANLIVAKSWADVVKLGAKQTQTKVVKHGPQRQVNRRQRRPNTPKKPTGPVHHQFSTGHANSPCTIIIGKAQIEKVTAPARPYRMLNNLVFSQKMDYNEDLSGLTEMFKTPVKETTRRTTTSPSTLSSSEKSLGKKPQVTNSGGKPLPLTLEISGSSVLSSTQKTAEPSETCFASPSLRRQSIRKDGNTEKAPRNISTMTPLEMRTPGFSPEPLKTVSSANKLRRSVELRNAEVPRVESKTEAGADAALALPGRRLRETPRGGQAGDREESAQSEGKGGRVTDGRRSRTGGLKSEPTASLTDPEKTLNVEPWEDPSGSQQLPGTPGCTQETVNKEEEATNLPCGTPLPSPATPAASGKRRRKRSLGKVDVQEEASALRKRAHLPMEATHSLAAPGGDEESIGVSRGTPEQKEDSVVYGTGVKRRPRTPKKTQPLEDLAGCKELFQTPKHIEESMAVDKTRLLVKLPEPGPMGTSTSTKTQVNTLQGRVDVKQECPVPERLRDTPREARHTGRVSGAGGSAGRALEASAQQALRPAAKPEPGDTPASTKGRPRTRLRTAEVKEEPRALRKPAQTSRATRHTRTAPGGEDQGSRASERSAQQARAPAARAIGIRRLRGAPEDQPLEDLAGSKEPIPAPGPTEGLAGEGKTTKIPCESPEAEPVATPAPPKRQPRAGLRKAPVTEEVSVQGEVAGTSGGLVHTHPDPKGDNKNITVLKEPVKRKLDPAAGTRGSKRRRGSAEGEAQPPEDLAGSKDPIPAPGPSEEPTRDEKTTETPCRSPQPEPGHTPASTKGRPRTRLRTAEVKEEPLALRNPARTSRATRHTRTAPGVEDQGNRASEGSAQQARTPAVRAIGIKRLRGTAEGQAQALEDLAGSKELIQAPAPSEEPTRDEKTTETPCRSPQSEPGHTPASTKGRPRTRLRTAEVKEEPRAVRKPARTSRATRHTRTAPGGEDQGSRASEGSAQQARAPAARATVIRRLRGAAEGQAQALEDLAGSKELIQAPGPSEEPTRDEKTTETPCRSPQSEPGDTPASTKGRPRTRLRTAEVKEEPRAVRKPARTSRATRHTRTAPGGEDHGSRASEGSAQQARAPAARATGIRRLRGAPEDQSLEDLAGSKEPIPAPGPTEGPQHDAHSRKSTPERTAERAKPLPTSSRVLRAPKGKPVEDQEGKGHPTAPQSRSNMSLPTGKSGTDGLLSGVGAPCSETGLQDTVQAKAVHGKKRAAPRERGRSPEPLIINKDLKILVNRIEPAEDHNSRREAGKRKLKVEDSAPADKGILLRTRHQNTTEGEEPRPEITVSAEKMKIKRQGKNPMEPSQEVGLQGPGDGDEKAESRAKVRGKRACLRAGIRNQISQSHTAEEEVTERSVAVPMKIQEEKGAAANSDFRCLRSRKPGMQPSLESESEQRVTRGAKRCAENLKVKDTVDTKKLRSRSHRHREDI
ncbi:marker of proliferation Ki-67 [Ictidomys tridecemlineatus]|nr:marker of proliferation Ki-67 [Ictidomys tridecemlineatus]